MATDNDTEGSAPQEKKKISQEVREISGDELLAFFEHVKPDMCCPMCGSDLSVMASMEYANDGRSKGLKPEPAIVGMVIDEDPDKGFGAKSPAFPLSCMQCGFIAYFLASKVLRWKRDHADTKS